jgi:hypothetical protein
MIFYGCIHSDHKSARWRNSLGDSFHLLSVSSVLYMLVIGSSLQKTTLDHWYGLPHHRIPRPETMLKTAVQAEENSIGLSTVKSF